MKPRRIRTVNLRGREAARVRAEASVSIAGSSRSHPNTNTTPSKK